MEINVDAKVVGVCVSGGVDSMVLLDIVRRQKKLVHVLHVHHGLRAQSDEEFNMVKAYCHKHQLKLWTKHIDKNHFPKGKSIQNEARQIRYQFFNQVAKANGLEMLLTAHHKDDQEETILFRVLTGRIHQPLGIEKKRIIDGVCYYRPLLTIHKQVLYDYAKHYNVPYYEDASNQDDHYDRNFIRNKVLPLLNERFDTNHLQDLLIWHQDTQKLMDSLCNEQFDINCDTLNLNQFQSTQPLLQREVLRKWIATHTSHYDLSSNFVNEMVKAMQTGKHQIIHVKENWHIYVLYDKLIIRNNNQSQVNEMHLSFPGKYDFNGYSIIYDDDEHIVLRTMQKGDKIKINHHRQKVSTILKDHKVPIFEREQMPLVIVNDEIIKVGNIKANQHPINQKIRIHKEN